MILKNEILCLSHQLLPTSSSSNKRIGMGRGEAEVGMQWSSQPGFSWRQLRLLSALDYLPPPLPHPWHSWLCLFHQLLSFFFLCVCVLFFLSSRKSRGIRGSWKKSYGGIRCVGGEIKFYCLKVQASNCFHMISFSFLIVGKWGYPALSKTVATSHM